MFRYVYNFIGARKADIEAASEASFSVGQQSQVFEFENELPADKKRALDTLLNTKGFEFDHQEEIPTQQPEPPSDPTPDPTPDPQPRDICDDGILCRLT